MGNPCSRRPNYRTATRIPAPTGPCGSIRGWRSSQTRPWLHQAYGFARARTATRPCRVEPRSTPSRCSRGLILVRVPAASCGGGPPRHQRVGIACRPPSGSRCAGQRRWAGISFGRVGERCWVLLTIRRDDGARGITPVRIRSGKQVLRPIVAFSHADRCQTSCPDCLRDYSNLAWHNILDWRMALDLARLALDANAPVDFTTAHWQSLVALSAPPYFRALGWTETTLANLPAARFGNEAEFIVHPLWADQHPVILQARSEAAPLGITALRPKTLFELLRRPF